MSKLTPLAVTVTLSADCAERASEAATNKRKKNGLFIVFFSKNVRQKYNIFFKRMNEVFFVCFFVYLRAENIV